MRFELWVVSCEIWDLSCEIRVVRPEFWVMSYEIWVMRPEFWVLSFELWVVSCELWDLSFELWVVGFGFRVQRLLSIEHRVKTKKVKGEKLGVKSFSPRSEYVVSCGLCWPGSWNLFYFLFYQGDFNRYEILFAVISRGWLKKLLF